MTRLYLVRHGRATAGWNVDPDPGLDGVGRQQAAATALRLLPVGPLPVVSSPLLRCRQTAATFALRWATDVRIEPGVAEIPSPPGVAMADRVEWLRGAMRGTWADLDDSYRAYRDGVVSTLVSLDRVTVVVSHFVAINAVIGVATGDDRLVVHSVDNASVTVVEINDEATIELVEAGAEADTLIR